VKQHHCELLSGVPYCPFDSKKYPAEKKTNPAEASKEEKIKLKIMKPDMCKYPYSELEKSIWKSQPRQMTIDFHRVGDYSRQWI